MKVFSISTCLGPPLQKYREQTLLRRPFCQRQTARLPINAWVTSEQVWTGPGDSKWTSLQWPYDPPSLWTDWQTHTHDWTHYLLHSLPAVKNGTDTEIDKTSGIHPRWSLVDTKQLIIEVLYNFVSICRFVCRLFVYTSVSFGPFWIISHFFTFRQMPSSSLHQYHCGSLSKKSESLIPFSSLLLHSHTARKTVRLALCNWCY